MISERFWYLNYNPNIDNPDNRYDGSFSWEVGIKVNWQLKMNLILMTSFFCYKKSNHIFRTWPYSTFLCIPFSNIPTQNLNNFIAFDFSHFALIVWIKYYMCTCVEGPKWHWNNWFYWQFWANLVLSLVATLDPLKYIFFCNIV